ncbi:hypothetical protein [Paenibacillus sp.]|uniref:hypothetical protein n=1 Tax=Paenibacillus sp. TaxID=58172 RepID=UPI002D465E08|nr:hypothetical protein [Paenibacillus sp.]HZG56554.1 hypothetical protein [Paenibacillus sp.]
MRRIENIAVWINGRAADERRSRGWNEFGEYVLELLEHRGIAYRVVSTAGALLEGGFDVVVAAVADDLHGDADAMLRFAERGGLVVALANLNRLAARIDHRPAAPSTRDYAVLRADDGPLGFVAATYGEAGAVRLRYASAAPWRPIGAPAPGADAFGSLPNGPLLQRFPVGSAGGRLDRFAVNVGETVVAVQQGDRPVLEDGVPAPDGTADVTDGVLKADDVMLMDWDKDRKTTASGLPYFAFPYADWWRELLVGYLVVACRDRGLALPFVGYWPHGIDRVAHLSHDSDFNGDEQAATTLALLEEQGIRSTWCMLEPGYSRHLYDRIREGGHEIAFHYNAVAADNGVWSEAEFLRQFRWLQEATGERDIATNKNHLTRVEGWGELFRWCEKAGIASDQTRGPSKKGNVGFLYGTSHPYFPAAWADENNRRYDVLQVGFLTPDMNTGKWTDDTFVAPMLDEVARTEGVAHFLFHQYHLHHNERVRSAYRIWAEEARARGFTFLTNREINDWERARRAFRIGGFGADGAPAVDALGGPAPAGTVVWVPVVGDAGAVGDADIAERYGVPCRRHVLP